MAGAARAADASPGLPQPVPLAPEVARLIELTNAARREAGLEPLEVSPALMRSAEAKACDMLEKGYFNHYAPDGTSPFVLMRQAGANYSAAGENLAQGALLPGLFASWLKSEKHRQNILNPVYTHLGIGLARRKGDFLVVQHFARLRPASQQTVLNQTVPNQTVTSPAVPAIPDPRTCVIQPGDSLATLAERLGVPAWRLILENKWAVVGELQPGLVIRVPQ